jgi:hypothetical protein
MCFSPEPLSAMSIVSVLVVSVFVLTHHPNQFAVKAYITSVRFDSNSPALETTSPHIGKPTAVNRGLLDVLHIR